MDAPEPATPRATANAPAQARWQAVLSSARQSAKAWWTAKAQARKFQNQAPAPIPAPPALPEDELTPAGGSLFEIT